jgi:hypothetical protein
LFNKKYMKIILLIFSFCLVFLLGVLFRHFIIGSKTDYKQGQKMMADYFYNEILNNFGSWSKYDKDDKNYEVFGGIDLKGPARIDFILINDVKSIIVYEYK